MTWKSPTRPASECLPLGFMPDFDGIAAARFERLCLGLPQHWSSVWNCNPDPITDTDLYWLGKFIVSLKTR
jgi:hypothetical protein